jgi:pimeloyl-ACP methyl ester carboxylesterase
MGYRPVTTSPQAFTTEGVDGVRIVADRLGDPLAPAVMFLHGGGQTRRSSGRAAAAVAERRSERGPLTLLARFGHKQWLALLVQR